MLLSAMLGTLSAVFAGLYLRTRAQSAELRTRIAALEAEVSARPAAELPGGEDEHLATVAHELRTPLTSIRSALGLLAGNLAPAQPAARNLVRIALTNTDRLIRLVNGILDLERLESGRGMLQARPCDLAAAAREAVEGMATQADAAGVLLRMGLALEFLAFPIHGDLDRMVQVVTNLLSNAIKFSPSGAEVLVDARAAAGWVQLTVSDCGRGVPEEQMEAIFERFHQVETADGRQKGGAGLGLAIARAIVQQHGGSISAYGHDGAGLTVCVKLPCAAIPEPVVLEPVGAAVAV